MDDLFEKYDQYIKNDHRGMPRPKQNVIKELWKQGDKKYLAKIVPIPWQSIASFDTNGAFEVNVRNEHKIFRMDLCPYCGIKIENNEYCVRWLSPDKVSNVITGTRVPSDVHPFHIECMKEGRQYCPYLREQPESNFAYGEFKKLKNDALIQLGRINEV